MAGPRERLGRGNAWIWRISGSVGIDKTSLARHFAAICEEDGTSHAYLDLQDLSYQSGFDLLAVLLRCAPCAWWTLTSTPAPPRARMRGPLDFGFVGGPLGRARNANNRLPSGRAGSRITSRPRISGCTRMLLADARA